LHDRLRLSS